MQKREQSRYRPNSQEKRLINRIQEFSQETGEEETQEGLFPIRKIWWCVSCQSGVRRSVKAYTEVDAGFGVCGVQSFGVSRGKCPGD